MQDLNQCEGYTYKGKRCTKMLRQTKYGNRLVLCRPHECQRVGKFKLDCLRAWQCHGRVIIYGRKKFLAALENRPLCDTCQHFAAQDKADAEEAMVETGEWMALLEGGGREKMRARIREVLGT